jgi:hypothetical protein
MLPRSRALSFVEVAGGIAVFFLCPEGVLLWAAESIVADAITNGE